MLKEVHDVLLEYYSVWYSAFLYFAAGSSNDPYHMPLNAYTAFLVRPVLVITLFDTSIANVSQMVVWGAD